VRSRVPAPGAREQLSATASRSAHAELYRRHHRNLQRAVARAIDAPRELVEDACQNAWTILLAADPDRPSSFGWLYVVATREAQRLCEVEHRCTHLEAALRAISWEPVSAHASCIDDVLEAREALGILASLPDRQRHDLTLRVAGFSYDEIAQLTGGRTFSTVRKSLDRAHAAIGRPAPRSLSRLVERVAQPARLHADGPRR
jgi:DNA-directed RNA polymerase specialized sigma24 family protein